MLNRTKNKTDEATAAELYGFVNGKVTRKSVSILRMLNERAVERNRDVYVCFID